MKTLVIIPAKAHSTRIPNKNLQDLGGTPLFAWTVQSALALNDPDQLVVVSTDDGPDGDAIARESLKRGAIVVRRPPELCRDPAQMSDVALHALERFPDCGTVVVLLPTSPFRTTQHIRDAIVLHESGAYGPVNVLSVCDATDQLHHKLCVRDKARIIAGPPLRCEDGGFEWFTPPRGRALMLNGAIWITTPDRLRKDGYISAVGALPYVMDRESGLDIDDALDLDLARAIVARRYETTAESRCIA